MIGIRFLFSKADGGKEAGAGTFWITTPRMETEVWDLIFSINSRVSERIKDSDTQLSRIPVFLGSFKKF
jgi:hypothetical protein